jgi:hypothetical protein
MRAPTLRAMRGTLCGESWWSDCLVRPPRLPEQAPESIAGFYLLAGSAGLWRHWAFSLGLALFALAATYDVVMAIQYPAVLVIAHGGGTPRWRLRLRVDCRARPVAYAAAGTRRLMGA